MSTKWYAEIVRAYVLRERVLLATVSADGEHEDQENDMPPGSGERPMVVNRDHPFTGGGERRAAGTDRRAR